MAKILRGMVASLQLPAFEYCLSDIHDGAVYSLVEK